MNLFLWEAISAKSQDFIMHGPDILWKVEILIWTVENSILNGWDFADDRSRISRWKGQDFDDDRSRFRWWQVKIFNKIPCSVKKYHMKCESMSIQEAWILKKQSFSLGNYETYNYCHKQLHVRWSRAGRSTSEIT